MTTPVQRSALGQLTLLGEGGQGRVYRTSGSPLLFKEFLQPEKVRVDRLTALMDVLAGMPDTDQAFVSRCSAFPERLVHDGGTFCGLLMPEAPPSFRARVGVSEGRLLELQYLTHPQKKVWSNLALPGLDGRLRFARTCVRLFDVLHRHGLVVGDVSMRNLLWSLTGDEPVFLLDCDSMRVVGHEPAVPAAFTPDWDDPCDSLAATLESDRYKLALVVLRVLTVAPTARPEDGVPRSLPPGVPAGVARLLAELATTTCGQPRPAAARWLDAFEDRGRIRFAALTPQQPRQSRITPASRPTIPVRTGSA